MSQEPMLPPERLLQIRSEVALRDAQLFEELASYVNGLIRDDFDQLVRILYRIDVSEPKLKQMLRDHPDEDAGKLIASLMIERQAEKIRMRKQWREEDTEAEGEERW